MTDEPQKTITPAVNAAASVTPAKTGGGLTYANATDDERVTMNQIIDQVTTALREGKSELIIQVGGPERKELADLSEKVLQSIDPQAKIAFMEALSQLVSALKENSLEAIRQHLQGGAISQLGHALTHMFGHKKPSLEDTKKMIGKFMTEVASSRKTITEMTDKLVEQDAELAKNYERINQMGQALSKAGQGTRIIRAATAEAIRRLKTGDITVMNDLETKAKSGRAEDIEALQVAQANRNNLDKVDGALLAATNIYDTHIARLAFTKNLNLQNRLQTEDALSITVSQWKADLAVYETMTVEEGAAEVLNVVDDLNVQSVKQGEQLFTHLTDLSVERAGSGTSLLRQLAESENHMSTTLQGLGARYHEKQLEQDAAKEDLEIASQKFKETTVIAFTKPGGIMAAPTSPPAASPS